MIKLGSRHERVKTEHARPHPWTNNFFFLIKCFRADYLVADHIYTLQYGSYGNYWGKQASRERETDGKRVCGREKEGEREREGGRQKEPVGAPERPGPRESVTFFQEL